MNGLSLKYFVLSPSSSDKEYAAASRAAMRLFSTLIGPANPQLADDLSKWVETAENESRTRE